MYNIQKKKQFFYAILLSAIFITNVVASDENVTGDKKSNEVKNTFKTSGLMFFNYMYELTDVGNGKGFNKFDIERTYLTFESSIANKVKVKVTTDVYQNNKSLSFKAEDGSKDDKSDAKSIKVSSYYDGWSVRLKNAYVDLNPVSYTTIRFGMIPTPWTSTEEKAWGYRFVKPTFADSEKLFSTADLGAGLIIKFPMNCGDAMLMVLNGTGYSKLEEDKYKDIIPKITIYPYPNVKILEGLSLSGYYYYGKRANGDEALDRNRTGALLNFNCDFVNVGGEFNTSTDQSLDKDKNVIDAKGNGYSVFGEIKFAKILPCLLSKSGILIRYDSWDPDKNAIGDAHSIFLAGLVYNAGKNIRAVIDLQKTLYESENKESTSQILCQVEAKF
jgi:hypothetical protein